MFANIPETTMRKVRWVLTIGWLLLILSLFYDPVSVFFTQPTNAWSPLRIHTDLCVSVQGQCLDEEAYSLGAPLFWGIGIPSIVFILLVFGHEFWRRICPLSFLSQLPRSLGLVRKHKDVNPKTKTGKVSYKTVKVKKGLWLERNHLYLQFGLFFLGLCNRILFVNSSRLALGVFLLCTIAVAMLVGYLYDGKAWCQYFCPMAPVQKIYAEPQGLLNSSARKDKRRPIPQSMCRTINNSGKEVSACVACKSLCMDIDAERSYWHSITKPNQQWLYYGYVGLVVGYFAYYYLYAGNWHYYLSGAWAHESNQFGQILKPGFYIFGEIISIPKLLAAPLTLSVFTFGGYCLGRLLEKRYRGYQLSRGRQFGLKLARHHLFTLCTFLIFNFFFIFAGKNFIVLLPEPLPKLFSAVIVICSFLWMYRMYKRRPT